MPDRYYFHNRLDTLGVRMKGINAPVDIIYSRGDMSVQVEEVTVGKTNIEEVYPGVDILVKETRDYIFDFPEISETIGLPKPGDIVEETDSGLKCQTVAVNEDHCFRWTTETRKRIRIHTQIIRQIDPL